MDISLGRHEDEDIPLIDGRDFLDGCQHGLLQVRVAAVFVGRWSVASELRRDRFGRRLQRPARGLAIVAKCALKRAASIVAERDGQFQIASFRQQPLQISNEKIDIQRPLVGLVQDYRIVASK